MRLYSTSDAAKIFNCSRELVKHWIATGQIDCYKTGSKHAIFTDAQLEEFARRRATEPRKRPGRKPKQAA